MKYVAIGAVILACLVAGVWEGRQHYALHDQVDGIIVHCQSDHLMVTSPDGTLSVRLHDVMVGPEHEPLHDRNIAPSALGRRPATVSLREFALEKGVPRRIELTNPCGAQAHLLIPDHPCAQLHFELTTLDADGSELATGERWCMLPP